MDEESHWQENPENGITPGPEEALRRETEKSKTLKVERLQLRNEIETLRSENRRLQKENRQLKEKLPLPEEMDTAASNRKPEPEEESKSPFPAMQRYGLLFLVFVNIILCYYTFGR